MIKRKEEKIGIKVTLTALVVWLVVIIILVIISAGVFPIDNFTVEGLLIFLIVFTSTIFWGARAGKEIIRHKKHDDLIGIKTVFIIFLTLLIPMYIFDADFSKITYRLSLTDTVKGFLSYFLIYLIPIVITGIIIGRRIKKLGAKC